MQWENDHIYTYDDEEHHTSQRRNGIGFNVIFLFCLSEFFKFFFDVSLVVPCLLMKFNQNKFKQQIWIIINSFLFGGKLIIGHCWLLPYLPVILASYLSYQLQYFFSLSSSSTMSRLTSKTITFVNHLVIYCNVFFLSLKETTEFSLDT